MFNLTLEVKGHFLKKLGNLKNTSLTMFDEDIQNGPRFRALKRFIFGLQGQI